jgi:GT2 family glycosyltransferase
LDYPDFEILVLPDEPIKNRDSYYFCKSGNLPKIVAVPIFVIPTGPVSPAHKRDMALEHARGEIIAFLDDDAYPVKDWLTHAVKYFSDEAVGAVGGPAVTPESDSSMQKASGAVYASVLVSGKYGYRYVPRGKTEVEDYPSCNLLVRKSILLEVGGFNTLFWPGEDTKLCLDITKKLGKKIIYDPGVVVYHHRRPLFKPHLKQISSYALHRGYFVKKYPETSLRIAYFLPSLLVAGLIFGGITSIAFPPFRLIYFLGVYLYVLLVIFFSFSKQIALIPPVFFGIIITHITYGVYFLKGLLSQKLSEEKYSSPQGRG